MLILFIALYERNITFRKRLELSYNKRSFSKKIIIKTV